MEKKIAIIGTGGLGGSTSALLAMHHHRAESIHSQVLVGDKSGNMEEITIKHGDMKLNPDLVITDVYDDGVTLIDDISEAANHVHTPEFIGRTYVKELENLAPILELAGYVKRKKSRIYCPLPIPDAGTIKSKGLIAFKIDGEIVWAKNEANALLNYKKSHLMI